MRRPLLTIGLAILLVAGAAACGDDHDDTAATSAATTAAAATSPSSASPSSPSSASPAAAPGGELSFGSFSPLTSLDPAIARGGHCCGGVELGAVYGQLLRWEPDTRTYVGYVAESIDHSSDYVTWTLKLRDGYTFTDGTPFDAATVVANIQRHMDKATASSQAAFAGFISTVEAVDQYTVKFTLKSGWSGFPYALTWPLGEIASAATLQAFTGGDKAAVPVGAGAFSVKDFRPGEALEVTANKNFAGGAPLLDGIKFSSVAGGQATLDAVKTKEFQAASLIDPAPIDAARDAKLPTNSQLADLGNTVLINQARPTGTSIMADVRLRKAVALALAPQFVRERAYQGHGLASQDLVPEESKWHDATAQNLSFDADEAAKLVSQVKSETGWDGDITYTCINSPDQQNLALAMKAALDKVGFTTDLKTDLDSTAYVKLVFTDRDFDLGCFGVNAEDDEPYPQLFRNLSTKSAYNQWKLGSAAIDAALDKLRVAGTDADRQAALDELSAAWTQDVPMVNLRAQELVTVYQPTVHGLMFTTDGLPLFEKVTIG
jgi:peptide/nickel transport system substrate-binding protein